jgi:hypothetical protein
MKLLWVQISAPVEAVIRQRISEPVEAALRHQILPSIVIFFNIIFNLIAAGVMSTFVYLQFRYFVCLILSTRLGKYFVNLLSDNANILK